MRRPTRTCSAPASGTADRSKATSLNSPTLGVAPYRDEVISPFRKTFSALFAALEYRKEPNPLGFPKVILWRLLLRNLIDVLLFWMLSINQVFDGVDNHLTRFVIFWLLCCRNDDRASKLCFRLIREKEVDRVSLNDLYRVMTDDFSLSRQLLRPETLKEVLVCKAPCRWRSITDRIGPNAPLTVEFITRWWWDLRIFYRGYKECILRRPFHATIPPLTVRTTRRTIGTISYPETTGGPIGGK